MKTIYINNKDHHNKFCQYEIIGNKVKYSWGRIGGSTVEKIISYNSLYDLQSTLYKIIEQKKDKGYQESSKEKLQEENNVAQNLGIQNKIDGILWVDKKNNILNQIDQYDSNKYVYVEILNSWKKERIRLLLSKTDSFKIVGGTTETNRNIYFNDIISINRNDKFIVTVRSVLMKMSEIIVQTLKTVKFGAVGIRNLFEDNNFNQSVEETLRNVDRSGFDNSVIMKFASMGNRNLDL